MKQLTAQLADIQDSLAEIRNRLDAIEQQLSPEEGATIGSDLFSINTWKIPIPDPAAETKMVIDMMRWQE